MNHQIFTNCNLLGGEDSFTLMPDMTIEILDGVITAVYQGSCTDRQGAEVLDMKGAFVMPGLINLHVHLPGSGKPMPVSKLPGGKKDKQGDKDDKKGSAGMPGWIARSMESGFLNRGLQKQVKKSLLAQLHSGVTTVRSVGELYYTDLANRDQILAGAYVGPRLLVSGTGVSVPDGHMAGTMAAICTTPEQAVRAVNAAIEKKVDWIKIFVTGGVLDASDTGEPARLRMPLELARAACDAAHAKGMRVAAHAESTEGVRVSLKAGVDTIEHGGAMDDEILSLYQKNHASVTLTISPALAIAELPEKMTGMNAVQRDCARYAMEGMITGAKQALAAGIPVGLGTDSSCPYITQYDMWREIYYFAKYCNVDNGFALYTATAGNAKILNLQDVTGQIKPGLAADLIVLERNPLDDLSALRDVKMVMVQGNLIQNPVIKRIAKIDAALDNLL